MKFWFFIVIATVCVSCAKQPSQRVLGGKSMGTTWSAKVISTEHSLSGAEITQRIQQRLDDIEQKMSNWKPDSEVSRFNAMAAGCMAVSDETAFVVESALALSQQSQGAFDITLGPLIELWGFGQRIGTDQVPAKSEVADTLANIVYEGISVQNGELCKRDGRLQLNVSAIAKGYGVDQAAQRIESMGYDRYLIEVGGELFGKGHSLREQPWVIGVEKPVVSQRSVMDNVLIPLNGQGLATSGDYRIFFEQNGQRYSHLLNPATGYPVTHQVASVTVLAQSSMLADGYATTLQVMGVDAALALANQLDLAVMVLEYAEGDAIAAHTSEAWRRELE